MSLEYDILVAGDYCLDLIFTGMEGFPELGKELMSSGFDMIPGGSYNTAVVCARLGMNVGWACDFGKDSFSKFVLEKIAEENISTDLFVHHSKPLRRVTVSISYPQERAFLTYYDPEAQIPAALKALAKAGGKIFYVPGLYYGSDMDAGLLLLKSKRMKLVMDGNCAEEITIENPGLRKALKNTAIFFANSQEVKKFTQENDLHSAMQKLSLVCNLLVVKDGSNGAYAVMDDETIHVSAIPVTPIDTTGAGDCFNAGFLKAWLSDLPINVCLQWGNIVGGLSTLARGGTGQIVRIDDILAWKHYYETMG
jgi:sugar/nucleoside kinase (ribokinase family)